MPAAETRSNSSTGGPQHYPGSASAPLPQNAQQSAAGIPTPGLVRRGTKRRGSDTCIVLLAVDDSNSSSSTLDDTRSHSPASLSHAAFPCAKRVYRARSTLSSRKSRKMIGTNGSSPSLFAEFGSASVSAPASTVVSPSTFASYEHARNPNNVALLATESRSPYLRTGDVECCSSLYRAHDAHGENSDSLGDAAAAAGGRGKAHAAQLQQCSQADAEGTTAGNNSHDNPKAPSVFLTPTTDTAASPAETPGCAAHPTTDGGHAPHKTLSGSASGAHMTDSVCAVLGASSGDSDSQSVHESNSSSNNNSTAERSEHASLTSSSAMVVDDEEDKPLPTARASSGSSHSAATLSTAAAAATSRLGRSISAPASATSANAAVGSSSELFANVNMLSRTNKQQQHQQHQQRRRQQHNHQKLASNDAAATAIAIQPRTQVCALPPINRYTLRELKIQNILQNPRLRHEVLFEPKLEFRPNSSGQLADTKQRAALQYWAAVEQAVKMDSVTPSLSTIATITMLIVEIREILAEMAEDSSKAELAHHAVELRERLDEQRIRQQLENRAFDAAGVVTYIVAVMEQFAQASRKAVVARVLVYVQRGRFVRALRAAFDILECIKIETANRSIEMYREYMRSTAVAFERSHFSMAIRRNTIELSDTTEWWRRALAECKKSGSSLEEMFREAGRELILDDGQTTPGLFRMDETRIQVIRKEAERLSIVGMVFLAFVQFVQIARRSSAGAGQKMPGGGSEFINAANGRIDHERLAAECLQLVPEGCSVQWTESLLATRASSVRAGGSSASRSSSSAAARGEIGFSHLVSELVFLSERILMRELTGTEIAMLERTLLRTARYECPLREVVEERVSAAVRLHTDSLTALCGKVQGSEWEAMPQTANDILRKAMLSFLAPALSTLAIKINSVVSHHWQVYRSFYVAVSTSASSGGKRNSSKGDDSNSSSSSNSNGRGGASTETPSNTSSSANTIHAA
ncbi:cAMP-mediated signaling protein sok1 [Coemansia sp. RSA 1200]|nr:cAMP-mediated signaling protein sok1 [Coemansia sp. RSA 1200]